MLEYYRFKTAHDLFVKGKAEEAKAELAKLQRRYVELCDENTTFKMQIQEYEDILYLARNLSYDGQFYWLETGSVRQGPFCPHCYEKDGLLMRLSGDREDRFCTACRATFQPRQIRAAAVPHLPVLDYEADLNGRTMQTAPLTRQRAKIIPFRAASS